MFDTTNFQRRIWVIIQVVFSVAMIVLTKQILKSGVNPLTMTWEMLMVAGAVLFSLLLWRGEKVVVKEVKEMALPGVIGGGLAYWLGFLGLNLTQAASYAFLTKLTVVFTCILAYFVLNEKWTHNKTSSIVLIIIGSFLMTTRGVLGYVGRGELLVIVSSFCYAVSYVLAARSMQNISALAAATYRTVIGGLVLMFISISNGFHTTSFDFQIVIGGLVVAIAVLSAHKVMRVSNASYMVLMSSVIPIGTALVMIGFFNEQLVLVQVLGAMAILLGTYQTEVSPTKA